MITGIVQTTKVNDYGYCSYKISSTWYGADSKGPPRASEGEKVSFEAFDKPGREGKVYPTIKLATFKKLPTQAAEAPGASPVPASVGNSSGSGSKAVSRDSYWSDKEANDKSKEPRIAHWAALDRAISFVDFALRNGAFPTAYEKARPQAKLEILSAFVSETTQRFISENYEQEAPSLDTKQPVKDSQVAEQPELESDPEESWS